MACLRNSIFSRFDTMPACDGLTDRRRTYRRADTRRQLISR